MMLLVLMLTACVASLAGGLALTSQTERQIAATHFRAVQTQYAADAAVRLSVEAVALEATSPRWPSVGTIAELAGGALVMNLAPGETVDLGARTAELNRDAARRWPIGPDTPQWRLMGWGPMPGFVGPPPLVAAWVADDVMDADGIPGEDRNGMLMIRVEAFGPRGAARAIVVRVRREAGTVRAMSWREE